MCSKQWALFCKVPFKAFKLFYSPPPGGRIPHRGDYAWSAGKGTHHRCWCKIYHSYIIHLKITQGHRCLSKIASFQHHLLKKNAQMIVLKSHFWFVSYCSTSFDNLLSLESLSFIQGPVPICSPLIYLPSRKVGSKITKSDQPPKWKKK